MDLRDRVADFPSSCRGADRPRRLFRAVQPPRQGGRRYILPVSGLYGWDAVGVQEAFSRLTRVSKMPLQNRVDGRRQKADCRHPCAFTELAKAMANCGAVLLLSLRHPPHSQTPRKLPPGTSSCKRRLFFVTFRSRRLLIGRYAGFNDLCLNNRQLLFVQRVIVLF
jgi:hypothetical protein